MPLVRDSNVGVGGRGGGDGFEIEAMHRSFSRFRGFDEQVQCGMVC
jgi:hypothetical protein